MTMDTSKLTYSGKPEYGIKWTTNFAFNYCICICNIVKCTVLLAHINDIMTGILQCHIKRDTSKGHLKCCTKRDTSKEIHQCHAKMDISMSY